jgi:Xaa-Pro aminopeptidase
MASETMAIPGNTLGFDFGVRLKFADGEEWCSDHQRCCYILRENEARAPDEIAKRFRTIIDAIKFTANKISAGMLGWEADKIARDVVIGAGYPDYDHATGHPVGALCHAPGVRLGRRGIAGELTLSDLSLEPGGVYTIEPRLAVENGVSIEEMIYINPETNRAEFLVPPQIEPILLNYGY